MEGRKFAIVWDVLNAFGQMVVASILWAVCCLPVVTIGPASAALYYTVVKVVRRDRGTVAKEFFHSFKENFRQGLFLNLIFLAYGAVIVLIALPHVDSWLEQQQPDTALYICAGLLLLVIWIVPYVYPVLSRFFYSNLQIFRFVLFIGVRYIYFTVPLSALLCAAIVFSAKYPVFLIITPALYTLLASLMIEPIFRKHSLPDDAGRFDAWYAKDGTDETD